MHVDLAARLKADPWFIGCLWLILALGAVLVIGPWIVPHDPHDMSFVLLAPPSADHWLGVNDGGMDILAELLYGLRNTVVFGLVAGGLALVLSAVIGLAAAWFGGLVDAVCMRVADILLSVPAVMVLIVIAAFFRPAPLTLALILGLLFWPSTAKGLRAQALVVKNRRHVTASRQMGASGARIIAKHLIPELFPFYLIGLSVKVRMAIFMEASLAFLGLFDPSRKSLGLMISFALKYYYLDVWWNWLLPPVLVLSALIMAVTFLALSMEKHFDPRLREAL